ncbi:hypothetical protein VTO42DRAFT_8707 [Malbranchea cinnamomea]
MTGGRRGGEREVEVRVRRSSLVARKRRGSGEKKFKGKAVNIYLSLSLYPTRGPKDGIFVTRVRISTRLNRRQGRSPKGQVEPCRLPPSQQPDKTRPCFQAHQSYDGIHSTPIHDRCAVVPEAFAARTERQKERKKSSSQ